VPASPTRRSLEAHIPDVHDVDIEALPEEARHGGAIVDLVGDPEVRPDAVTEPRVRRLEELLKVRIGQRVPIEEQAELRGEPGHEHPEAAMTVHHTVVVPVAEHQLVVPLEVSVHLEQERPYAGLHRRVKALEVRPVERLHLVAP
jgi:hypothetical protein